LYYVPGGSGTWKFRSLVFQKNINSQVNLINWHFDYNNIHGHLVIEAIGEKGLTVEDTINISQNAF